MTPRPTPLTGASHAPEEAVIATDTPHPARMYDHLLGGATNFQVDRDAVAAAAKAVGGLDRAKADVRANRDFLGRAIRYLATEAGIRQFLDIGTGIPNGRDDTHTVAQDVAPGARIVYVDNDPIVLANSHMLLRSEGRGAAQFVLGDLRDTEAILDQAAGVLDLTQPVGLILVAILHFVPDDDEPRRLVGQLVDALPEGSHVAISHLTADFAPGAVGRLVEALNQAGRDTFVPRTADQINEILDGLQLVEPGLVHVSQWHPDPANDTPPLEGWTTSFYGAVAHKAGPAPASL